MTAKQALDVIRQVCEDSQSSGRIKNLQTAVAVADALSVLKAAIDERDKYRTGQEGQ